MNMGKVIEWYVPHPKPSEPEQLTEEEANWDKEHDEFIKETLQKVLNDAGDFEDVCIIVKSKNGGVGFISTIEGTESNYTLIGRIHKRMLDIYESEDSKPVPPKAG